MATEVNKFQVWEDRWYALAKIIDEMESCYESAAGLVRKDTVVRLLRGLKQFGHDQFYFLYELFNDPSFRNDTDFPEEFVFASTLDQIGYDLEAIERAANQRLTGTTIEVQALSETDKLALSALQPAMDSGLIAKGTTCLTYLHKSPQARVTPHSEVALIGVPYGSTSVKRDKLAIPHEVGHYVFWHRERKGAASYKSSLAKNGRIPWREEIFADVYGCLIAGPVIAFDFQELEKQTTLKKFTVDDGKHPEPILRPLIYTQVLRARDKTKWGGIADDLDTRWATVSAERTSEATYKDELEKKNVEDIVNAALKDLAGIQSADWTGSAESAKVEGLDGQFESRYQQILDSTPAVTDIDPNSDVTKVWFNWKNRLLSVPLPPQDERPDWVRVFAAAGWTTDGPKDDPAQG